MATVAPFEAAVRLHEAGSLDAAAALYDEVLRRDPKHDEALHLLGLIAQRRGDFAAAEARIGAALALRPGVAHYHSNLGHALRARGRLAEAAAAIARARALNPHSARIASNLGGILTELGRMPDALAALREAVALDPRLADAQYNLANALCRAGDLAGALPVYATALGLADSACTHFNLGHALAALGRADEAASSYRRAIARDPEHADAHNNLGVLLQDHDRVEEAEACFAASCRLRPDAVETRCNLAACLLAQGRTDEAAVVYDAVLAREAGHGAALLGRLVATLPVVARDATELTVARTAYARRLIALLAAADDGPVREALAAAAGAASPFFLAYQGLDDRELQTAYGALMQRVAAPEIPPSSVRARVQRGERLRVGIVSGFFHEHTIHSLFLRGWLRHFDRSRFRLFGYHTGPIADAATAAAAAQCERFVAGRRSVSTWRAELLGDAPHILLYPEIGMDPVAARLAAERLAPLQCAAWGHPVSTGLATIDAFLSSELMEPEDGDTHYCERLIRLPRLGLFVEPTMAPAAAPDRAQFGLRADAVVYWCGQNLPKYHPTHDAVLARIARAVPGSQFVFIAFGRGRAMTERFRARLRATFAAHGLDADAHCVILPQLSPERFLAAAALCDVVLDTIGWSGGKSTLDLLAIDPAIVTLPGRFMRGRHTAAILTLAEATDTVARTVAEYVELAVRLGHDPARRRAARARLARGKERVFHDDTAIIALQDFLERAVRSSAYAA